jgi:selenocysteine-specific elongation factor
MSSAAGSSATADSGASAPPPTHIVATAGHVDHGKSTLIRTLTGTDPDRWAEEKQRGLTIDLGFAQTILPSGRPVSFIDVPGHIRFLKNMLAGVGGVDACLFVVAATEGWKPQSEEHLRILSLLGISHGVVALTKVGLVDDEWHELARLDVADHLTGTFLETAPMISVDALTGVGVDELRSSLDHALETTPRAVDRGRARLWIDRVFAAKGSGTVVTGTLTGGALRVDETIDLLGPTVRRRSARIRSLQSHGATAEAVGPGHRVAVNLGGIAHDELARGDAIVHGARWHSTARVDAELTVLEALDHEVSRRGAFALYLGSGEYPVKLRILGTDALPPGGTGAVRIHLPVALPLQPGDRFILRDHGRSVTVGGGAILDVAPLRAASKAKPSADPASIVETRGWVTLEDFDRLSGGAVWSGRTVERAAVSESAYAATRREVVEAIEAAGPLGLDPAMLSDRERAVIDGLGDLGVHREHGRLVIGEVRDEFTDHPFRAALRASPFAPPDPNGVDRGELRELVRRKLVIEQDGVYFAPEAMDQAAAVIAELLSTHTDGVTVSEVRDALGATRKHVLPLLAWFDANGRTRRRGDVRIAGPRLLG